MGALRSGTNILAQMLETHWSVEVDFHAYGWKHAGVPVLAPSSPLQYPSVPIAWICKSPHALVWSMHRYRLLTETGSTISLTGELGFEAFMRSPITIWDSRLPFSPRLHFANPVQYWNFLTWNLETLDPERFSAVCFNYEDIVADPSILTRIEEFLPVIRRTTGCISLPKTRMKRGTAKAKTGSDHFNASAVKAQSHLSAFSPDDLDFVAAQVDPWLMQRRGYELP